MEQLQQLDRFVEPEHQTPLRELLWSDPDAENGWAGNPKGTGYTFGPDVTSTFLSNNSMDFIIRSGQIALDVRSVAALSLPSDLVRLRSCRGSSGCTPIPCCHSTAQPVMVSAL